MRCFLNAIFIDFGIILESNMASKKLIAIDIFRCFSQDASKTPQDVPTSASKAPQETPRVPQEQAKVTQECPETRQERPKSFPRGPNHAPKSEKAENFIEKLPLQAITQKIKPKTFF